MTLLGLDISHFQSGVNFAAAKTAQRDFVVLKATEGIGYVDPSFAGYRKAAHAAGLIVGIYHFGRDNSPTAEAAYFAGAVGALQPNEFLVLDQEVPHASGNVPWCTAWLDATRAHYGLAPFIYMNKGSSTGIASGNWTQVARTYALWAAIYDNSTTQPAVPYWGSPAMKQYSDKGSVLGVAGTCDVDVFYGSTAQLLAYCTPGGTNVATAIDMNAFLNTPAYYVNGGTAAGPSISQVLMNLDQFAADVFRDGKQIPLRQEIADAKTAALATQATTADIDTKVGAVPAVDAKALAAALVADAAAVSTLADALAAAIAKRLGNG